MPRATRLAFAALATLVPLVVCPQAAGAAANDPVFLSDSCQEGDGMTRLFLVEMDEATQTANLELLTELPLEQVDALACTADAGRCYAIDKYHHATHPWGGMMGVYDLVADTWNDVGWVVDGATGQLIECVVLAAFSPDGRLYIASQESDLVYVVDLGSAEATVVGPVIRDDPGFSGFPVDLMGADFTFTPIDVEGDAYLWTNAGTPEAPSGLYRIFLPPTIPGIVEARWVGGDPDHYYTGLATLAGGYGDVLGSNHEDEIHINDRYTGADLMTCDMMWGGLPYDYMYGDMSSGHLGTAICRSAGFWGTHGGDYKGRPDITGAVIDSAGGMITVCGETIDHSIPIGDLSSAIEGLCVRTQGVWVRQLYRQLVAARLNCALSGVAQCELLVPGYDECDVLCTDEMARPMEIGACIDRLDCFNNGGLWDDGRGACIFEDANCHTRPLCDSPDPNLCFDPPGPASSARDCKEARGNDCTIDDCPAP